MGTTVYYDKETPLGDAISLYKTDSGQMWLENRNKGRTMVFEIEGDLKDGLIEMLMDDWKEKSKPKSKYQVDWN